MLPNGPSGRSRTTSLLVYAALTRTSPLHLWDQRAPQAELMVNIMQGSQLNPKISAHTQLNGHFDFNQTPTAPPGIRVLAHIKPAKRTTWSPHAEDGWYIGPAMESYQCYCIWFWDSRATRICDTITWLPTKITMPLATTADLILAGIMDIQQALQHAPSGLHVPPSHVAALKQLIDILMAGIICKDEDPAPNPQQSLRVKPSQAHVIASQEVNHAPLRVDKPSSGQEKMLLCKVHFAPVPSMTAKPTYETTTGTKGAQCCKQQCVLPLKPISQAKTVYSKKSTHHALPPAAIHCYETRSKGKLNQPLASPQIALLGTAVNPDTGKIAEYKELSQCSEGPLWQASNAKENGRLTQGFGSVNRKKTMFFIPHTSIPKNKKAIYLQVVAAFCPEKTNPR
jgi:hypothetical protein